MQCSCARSQGWRCGGEHYGQENTDVGEHTIKIQMSEMRCSDVKRTEKQASKQASSSGSSNLTAAAYEPIARESRSSVRRGRSLPSRWYRSTSQAAGSPHFFSNQRYRYCVTASKSFVRSSFRHMSAIPGDRSMPASTPRTCCRLWSCSNAWFVPPADGSVSMTTAWQSGAGGTSQQARSVR